MVICLNFITMIDPMLEDLGPQMLTQKSHHESGTPFCLVIDWSKSCIPMICCQPIARSFQNIGSQHGWEVQNHTRPQPSRVTYGEKCGSWLKTNLGPQSRCRPSKHFRILNLMNLGPFPKPEKLLDHTLSKIQLQQRVIFIQLEGDCSNEPIL